MKSVATTIRKSLLETDFGLEDRFSDAEELKSSWESAVIPDEMMTFFFLFNSKQIPLLRSYKST